MEQWRPIPGLPDYEVTNVGSVRSLNRTVLCCPRGVVNTTRQSKGKLLKPILNREGYLVVNPYGKRRPIHQLVASAWIGPCPDGMVIDHLNGNKTDNRPENLEYVTNEENIKRAHRNGLMHAVGEGNGRCCLSDEQVGMIRAIDLLWTLKRTAQVFGVSTTQIRRILSGDQRLEVSAT